MRLEELHFFLDRFSTGQFVEDLLLGPAPHHHVALLEVVREVLHHLQDAGLGAPVHEIWFGQDSCEKGKRMQG